MNYNEPPRHPNEGHRDDSGYDRGYNNGFNQGFNQGYNQANRNYYTSPDGLMPSQAFMNNDLFADAPEGKSRGVTALLCLFLGYLGIHYFYVGKIGGGFIYLAITLCTCFTVSSILSLVQAIMLFCMRNEEFRAKYLLSSSAFPF